MIEIAELALQVETEIIRLKQSDLEVSHIRCGDNLFKLRADQPTICTATLPELITLQLTDPSEITREHMGILRFSVRAVVTRDLCKIDLKTIADRGSPNLETPANRF